MRLDDWLSTVGVVKRRTVAKELGQNGLIHVNGRRVKPAFNVSLGDVVAIRGTHPITVEVLGVPTGSVSKERREEFYRVIPPTSGS